MIRIKFITYKLLLNCMSHPYLLIFIIIFTVYSFKMDLIAMILCLLWFLIFYLIMKFIYKKWNILWIEKLRKTIIMSPCINLKNLDDNMIKQLFVHDFKKITKLAISKKWKQLNTCTHIVIAHRLINDVLNKYGEEISKEELTNINEEHVIKINKEDKIYCINIKKKKKQYNWTKVLKYKWNISNKELKKNFRKIDFYKIKIDMELYK